MRRNLELEATIVEKYAAVEAFSDKRGRRIWVATELHAIGYGGDALVSDAPGLSRPTIRKGHRELESGGAERGRIRRAGAGRPGIKPSQPGVKHWTERRRRSQNGELRKAPGLSPTLGNLYLHYTLDVWFEREVKPRLRGEATLVHYCDDYVIEFERREDTLRVREVLGKRMERYGLRLHPEKTRLIAFERPEAEQRGGKGPRSFDFLWFTMYWQRTQRGRCEMWCKTRSKGLRRFNRTVCEWVSAPSAPTGAGPARSAHETLGRTLQLLRGERQPPKPDQSGLRHDAGLVQMAAPSQPANASHVGAIRQTAGTIPASPPARSGAHMGRVDTRHISGRAGNISLSGSGEGLGRAIVRGYSTTCGEVGNLDSINVLSAPSTISSRTMG